MAEVCELTVWKVSERSGHSDGSFAEELWGSIVRMRRFAPTVEINFRLLHRIRSEEASACPHVRNLLPGAGIARRHPLPPHLPGFGDPLGG